MRNLLAGQGLKFGERAYVVPEPPTERWGSRARCPFIAGSKTRLVVDATGAKTDASSHCGYHTARRRWAKSSWPRRRQPPPSRACQGQRRLQARKPVAATGALRPPRRSRPPHRCTCVGPSCLSGCVSLLLTCDGLCCLHVLVHDQATVTAYRTRSIMARLLPGTCHVEPGLLACRTTFRFCFARSRRWHRYVVQ